MLSIIRWIRGYYVLKITGYSPERFFNLCKINHIVLWYFHFCNQSEYQCCIRAADYEKLGTFLVKTGTTAEILSEKGLFYSLKKNQKRFPYFLGVIVCLMMLYFLSFFIWSFEIDGNKKVSDELIIRFLRNEGIYYGSLKKDIDIEKVEENLREYFHHISWVSIKIDGTRFYLSMKEVDAGGSTNSYNNSVPRHIYADLSGKIMGIITRKGSAKVKEGDMINAGDLMIEGYIPIYDDSNNLIQQHEIVAEGDYTIRTSLNIQREISRYYRFKHYTNRESSVYYFRFGNHYFALNLFKNKYQNNDIKEYENRPIFFQKLNIPLYFGKRRYIEYIEKEELYDEKEARILLNQSIENLIKELNEKGVQIIEKNVKIEIDHQKIKLNCNFVIDVTREY